MEAYESVLLVKSEVFVYKIPPRTTNRGYRAADWNLGEPEWTGRMKVLAKGNECVIKLEDKNTGELFAKCPIEQYPGVAIEAVADSSRYFVLRLQDDNGRSAFIGIGFSDRSDSFDLNVSLQDHFKRVKTSEEIEKEKEEGPKQQLDLKFKEGETIKINMKITKKDGSEVTSRPKARPGSSGILPPPPGGVKAPLPKLSAPPTSSPSHAVVSQPAGDSNWGDFASAAQNQSSVQPPPPSSSSTSSNSNWVQF